jgi:hypothetical protein
LLTPESLLEILGRSGEWIEVSNCLPELNLTTDEGELHQSYNFHSLVNDYTETPSPNPTQ